MNNFLRMIGFVSLIYCSSVFADKFETLLQQVKQQSTEEITLEQARLARFKAQKHQQASLLAEAESQLQQVKAESLRLSTTIDNNEQQMALTEERLQRKTGDLGEVFGTARQVAGEFKAELDNSLTSAQFIGRQAFLDTLVQSRELPNASQLRKLWYLMLQEMVESGRSNQFEANVTQNDGSRSKQTIIRYGAYSAVGQAQYLGFHPETQSLTLLPTQPPSRYASTANAAVETDSQALRKIMIDPTRGQLLNLLSRKPGLGERLHQGGLVGYIILVLGAVGLVLGAIRYFYLQSELVNVNRQAKQLGDLKNNNALGRIALAYQKHQDKNLKEREIALEEAMLQEVPGIEKYSSLLKLFAAVAPLLGLLGTVIGMIITFQSITLFGTSDPKLMAGGISTALVTTVLGLSVSIPLLFAHTILAAKAKEILDLIEHQSVGLIARHGV